MRLVFDHRMFRHINEMARKEERRPSRAFVLLETLFQVRLIVIPLALLERLATLILCLPIPLYSGLVYVFVNNMRGLPSFAGMYVRALYYRGKLRSMGSNVFIDQNVFIAYPERVDIGDFCYIDKYVMIMSNSAKIGRRVHLAPRVFVSGGGELEIEDYVGVAANVNIITATEGLKHGTRASGPMVSAEQRQLIRGKVHLKRDSFMGVGVTILPNVEMAEGSVAGVGVTLTKDTQPWAVYVGAPAKRLRDREPVKFPEDR